MRFDRLTVLTLLLVAALIGTAAWRYQHLAAARERARASSCGSIPLSAPGASKAASIKPSPCTSPSAR